MGIITEKDVEFFLSENFDMNATQLLKNKQPNQKFTYEHQRILENLFTKLTGLRLKDECISVEDWRGDFHYWKYKSFKDLNTLNDIVTEINWVIDQKKELNILIRTCGMQQQSEDKEQDLDL